MKKPIVLATLLAISVLSNARAVSVSVGTQVGGATTTDVPSLAFITNNVVLAANLGGADLVRDGLSFTSFSSADDPTVVTRNGLTVTISGNSGGLSTATFGDALFGSFIWANGQSEMSVKIDGLSTNKAYHVYYLDGDNRSIQFNMVMTVTASNTVAAVTNSGTMSWGNLSASGNEYIYLPVAISGVTTVNARMTQNGSSGGAGLAGLIVAEDSTPNTISVSFGADQIGVMSASELAGVVAMTNWNSVSNASSSATQLIDNLGATTGAGVSWSSPNTWPVPITNAAGDFRMMKGYLDTGSSSTTTVTVTNIPSSFSTSTYDVIVYCDGNNDTEQRVGKYWINSTTNYLRDARKTDFSGTYVQAVGFYDAGTNTPAGNYVRFYGLTNSSFTLKATPGSTTGSSARAPINGIQIVASSTNAPSMSINPTNQSICSGSTVYFAAQAIGSPAPTTKWQVKTNGGSSFLDISSATNALYSFSAALTNSGSQFRAVFTNAYGSVTSAVATLTVNDLPVALPSLSPGCANSSGFASSMINNAGDTYSWGISNGTITAGSNSSMVSIVFGSSGTTTVYLTVTNASGCTATGSTSATIYTSPDATISAAASVPGNSTTNTASAPAGGASYSWSITNGVITSATNLQAITYTAGQSGSVGLRLTVANNGGCTSNGSVNVPIDLTTYTNLTVYDNLSTTALTGLETYNTNNPAWGDFLTLRAAGVLQSMGLTVYCSGSQTGSIQTATTLLSFYDNTTAYSGSGAITNPLLASVSIDWNFGSSGLASGHYVRGTANLSSLNLYLPTNVLVVQQLTNITGTCTRHGVVLFGNATTGSSSTNYYYQSTQSAPGIYYATGLSSSQVGYSITVSMIAPVIATNPVSQTACAGSSVSFTAAATGTPTPTLQWQVKTNGGSSFANISGATNATYSFTSSLSDSNSQYQAVFSNTSGSVTTTVATLTVNPLPSVNIVIGPGASCPNSTASASTMYAAAGYSWGISNGIITSGTNSQFVSFTYGSSGSTTLYLTVTNASGCTASATTSGAITPSPTATITLSATNILANSTGNTASGPAGLMSYSWSITNGTITAGGGAQTVTYTAGASGNVGLSLTVENSGFCYGSSSANVAITVVPTNYTTGDSLTNWIISTAGQYVRLYTNSAAKTAGVGVATWTYSSIDGTNVDDKQPLPVYSGVQAIYSSSNWVYIRSSGMPAQTLGPLLAYSPANMILPTNQHVLYRFPRNAAVPTTKTLTTGGAIGFMVDGTTMFDIRDALVWNGSSEVQNTGTNGYWTRDAYVNEGYGFDPVGGHSAPGGAYHYHANPPALRYRLGDHVDFNPVTKTYSESTNTVSKHSPILGWTIDGFPVYGPYGYSNALDSSSSVRRMVSGMVLRNGQNGTANLSSVGRTNIPPWAQRIYGVSLATGPSVNGTYPLGRYLEDHDYLGDLTNSATSQKYAKGVDFDLDEYNGRFCVTPEFPSGIYAYFVSVDTNGTPVFPYYIGRAFYGSPTGGSVSALNETVTTNFAGVPNIPATVNTPTVKNTKVTLTWSGTEGGTYRVESSTNFTSWTTNSTTATTVITTGSYTNNSADSLRFYRVAQTALSNYDTVFFTNAPTITMSPTSGNRNTTISVTATISSSATPAPPTQSGAPVSSFTVGTLTVSNPTYTYSGGVGSVTGSLTIPSGATTGPQTVTIQFSPPPGQQSGPSYTQSNGFTIN